MELNAILGGEYYAKHYENEAHPTIIKASNDGSFNNSPAIYTRNKEITYRFAIANWIGCTFNIRKATPQEIHWLDCCIAKNDFVEYEIALKTFFQQDSEYNKILIKLLTQ